MKTMKAVTFASFGTPEVLTVDEMAVPELGPGDALVEVRAASINPSDVKVVAGAFHSILPRVPGRDYAGVVVSDGEWKGKSVWGSGPGFGVTRDGAHAQYVVLPADWLSEKPSNLSMEQASATGVPYIAAWKSLIDSADLQDGECILITGALGAVGRAATQIAHWKKATVIGADILHKASEADHFIDVRGKDLPAEVKALTGGRGVDLALDAVGGPMFEPALKSLRVGGRQVVITSVGNRRVEFDLMDFYHNNLRLIGVDTMKLTGPRIAAIMDALRSGFEKAEFQPSQIKTWPLEQAARAYSAVASGDVSAKQILEPV